MEKQVWQRVESLFHDALELPAKQRTSFIKQKTNGDQRLQVEVLTLLECHESESDFLERDSSASFSNAVDKLANEFKKPADDTKPSPGRAEEIEQELVRSIEAAHPALQVKNVINRGGMGTVFRVFQTQLERDVAGFFRPLNRVLVPVVNRV